MFGTQWFRWEKLEVPPSTEEDGLYISPEVRTSVPAGEGNLVSSLTGHDKNGNDLGDAFDYYRSTHKPVLDVDLPCALVPSTTPGHFHLYIDKEMPWNDYIQLLDILAWLGIVEPGYVNAAKSRGATFVRAPGVKKVPAEVDV